MSKYQYLAIALLIALPRVAHAEQTFPPEIKSHLGLGFTPPCTLCHATNAGGLRTITTGFGNALMTYGLTTNIDTLDPALDALASAKIDTNGDGIADVQQLKNGFDPNTGAPLSDVEQEQFGCGARIARRSAQSNGNALTLVGLLLLVLVRRKKAHQL